MSLLELANSLGVSIQRILRTAKREDVNLPFGIDSILHLSVIDKIKESIQSEEDGDETVIDVDGEEDDSYNLRGTSTLQ